MEYHEEWNDGKPNWISVSGGKDSTALMLWTIEQEIPNCRYVYADTQHEHSSVYEYLTYLEDRVGVSIERVQSKGFLQMCIDEKMFPAARQRFCTRMLKIVPIAKYIDAESDADTHRVFVGVRAEESASRAAMDDTEESVVQYPPRMNCNQMIYRPLIDWVVSDVFAIHRKHNIDPNPLYTMGAKRVGCFPCIMAGPNERRVMFRRFPEMVDKLEEWEAAVNEASDTGRSSFFQDMPEGITGIREYAAYLDAGPEIPGLEQDLGGCMSTYKGLCE